MRDGETTCSTCQWWSPDELGDGYCCNSSSPNATEFTYPHDTCEEHEMKDRPND